MYKLKLHYSRPSLILWDQPLVQIKEKVQISEINGWGGGGQLYLKIALWGFGLVRFCIGTSERVIVATCYAQCYL